MKKEDWMILISEIGISLVIAFLLIVAIDKIYNL